MVVRNAVGCEVPQNIG